MANEQQLRQTILQGTVVAFDQKGLKFTMDELAHILGMSKKTIYTCFRDKEELFLAMVDFLFDGIKESEQKLLEDESLGTVDKIRQILGVLPESYKEIDFRKLYLLKDKYPEIYKQVELRLESGWETTLSLMEQGIAEGVIRPVSLPIVKLMMEASLEQFFQRDVLGAANLSYAEGLEQVVTIIMDGITAK